MAADCSLWGVVSKIVEEQKILDEMQEELHARKEHKRYGGLLLSRYEQEVTEHLRRENQSLKDLVSNQKRVEEALNRSSTYPWIAVDQEHQESFASLMCRLPVAHSVAKVAAEAVKDVSFIAPSTSDWLAEKATIEEFSVRPTRVLSALDQRQPVLGGAAAGGDGGVRNEAVQE